MPSLIRPICISSNSTLIMEIKTMTPLDQLICSCEKAIGISKKLKQPSIINRDWLVVYSIGNRLLSIILTYPSSKLTKKTFAGLLRKLENMHWEPSTKVCIISATLLEG